MIFSVTLTKLHCLASAASLAILLLGFPCGQTAATGAIPAAQAPGIGRIRVGGSGPTDLPPAIAPEGVAEKHPGHLGTGCEEGAEEEAYKAADFLYSNSGADWDEYPTWACTKGQLQSPIDVLIDTSGIMPPVGDKHRVQFGEVELSNVNLMVLPILEVEMVGDADMNGFSVPVCSPDQSPPDVGCFNATLDATPTYYNLTFKNLHFHTTSEHAFNGAPVLPNYT